MARARASRLLLAASAAAAALLGAGGAAAEACGEALGPGTSRVENSAYVVAYRTQPAPVVVGQHFAVTFAVCAKRGAALPQSVQVDAHMPAHKHGMNYRAAITRASDGTYRAKGLMFHMPGRWEFVFQPHDGRREDRLTVSEDVR